VGLVSMVRYVVHPIVVFSLLVLPHVKVVNAEMMDVDNHVANANLINIVGKVLVNVIPSRTVLVLDQCVQRQVVGKINSVVWIVNGMINLNDLLI